MQVMSYDEGFNAGDVSRISHTVRPEFLFRLFFFSLCPFLSVFPFGEYARQGMMLWLVGTSLMRVYFKLVLMMSL
jgi:hypothetical protein